MKKLALLWRLLWAHEYMVITPKGQPGQRTGEYDVETNFDTTKFAYSGTGIYINSITGTKAIYIK